MKSSLFVLLYLTFFAYSNPCPNDECRLRDECNNWMLWPFICDEREEGEQSGNGTEESASLCNEGSRTEEFNCIDKKLQWHDPSEDFDIEENNIW